MTPPLLRLEHPKSLFRDLQVEPEEARSILRPQKDDRYGFGFALSPYRGCEHGCRYCYVRDYPQALPGGKGAPVSRNLWGTWSVPKLNAPELLWNQRHRLHGQTVFLASATDPYQPLEREFRLTRACLDVLLKCPTTRVLVHTRSPLVLQDLDLLKAFGDRLRVGLSIPTDDDTVRQVVEPKSPPIPSRWAAMERLARAGIEVNLAACPLMPVHNPEAFARRARESGAAGAWVGSLRLLDQDPFYEVLARRDWLFILDPDYVDRVAGVLAAEFPRDRRRRREAKAAPPPLPHRLPAVQRALFEGM